MEDSNDKTLINFLPVNRKVFRHHLWLEDRPFSKFEAWIDLIQSARFEDGEAKALIGGKLVSWVRGEFPASLRFLAERWKWSKNKVDDFLKLLENDNMIVKNTAKGTSQNIIKLCNYESYNTFSKKKGQQKGQTGDSEGTAGGQTGDESNKVNNVNNSIRYLHPFENIKISEKENVQLEKDVGPAFTKSCYEYLSDYKKEKNYKTKSDYLTIRRWVIDAVSKKNSNGTAANKANPKKISNAVNYDGPF